MKRNHIILFHVVFWILFSIIPQLPIIFPDKDYPTWVYYYNFSTELLNMLNFYLIYFSISLSFFSRTRLWQNLGLVALFILVYATFRIFIIREVYLHIVQLAELPKLRFYNIMMELVNSMLYSSLPIAIWFIIDWFNTQKLKAELINQTKTSELAMLKSQINPHFLFNTLNNLYSLVYKKSDEAPDVVMKLSEIMRYMLYDAMADRVPLQKEIEYLESYIHLQTIRLHADRFTDYKVNGIIEGKSIPPMLLIPFVENAFKHGKKNVSPPGITIHLDINERSLDFEVSNYIHVNNTQHKDPQQGIGLVNIRRRLEILYPGKYDLQINNDEGLYKVNLHIDEL
jgi:sensor histidine kinase YesM